MSETRYIRFDPEEVEILEQAMSEDFGSPSRVTKGGYVRHLCQRRLEGEL